ncbi:perilipin 6 [Oncorhynchus clarkii lewisi]|uniref:perilipin 6 n=1 Tax=Oncorhynchus clarkii lewisi TaxID=490388 RepID=UPI0039B99596
MSYTNNHYIEANAVKRVASLPLFDSALKTVVSVYMGVKGRYPLLGVVGGVTEIGVRNASQAAILRATPLLLSLEPQIEVVNNYACMGLDQLEKNFPVLHQSTEEVLGHLKDAFFLTLDDVQLRVNDELDGIQGRWDKLTDATWYYLLALQESQLGQIATSGLDDILTRSEEAMAKYMPLTAPLRLEWERRTQQYEDEDGEDEPGLWTRFRGLLLCLSLQLYHRLLKLRNMMLQDATERIGLSRLLEVVGSVLQRLQLLYVYQVLRLDVVRRLALDQLKAQVRVLAELGPVKQLLGLPAQVQLVVADLQELGKILLQLLVNSTPLYNMLQQPSDQDVEDFLNHQESMSSDTTRRSSANSLFLKAMDGRPHKRTSSYARSQRGSTSAPSPAPTKSPNSSHGSQKPDDQPLSCLGSQKPDDQPLSCLGSQKPDDQPLSRLGSQKPDDQPLSRLGSQKLDDQPLSRRGSQMPEDQPLSMELDPLELPSTSTVLRPSSAAEVLLGSILQYLSSEPPSDETIIPKVETTEDLSPEKVSDEAMESTEYYSDARDVSPSRRNSLSAHSHRSSSSAGNPDDQPLSRRGSQKPDDQPLSRRGSQKPDGQPLFLELDPLELHSTSTVSHPSLAAEVLLGSILQYISSEPPSDEPVVPEVETTKNHTEARDESPPRCKSLSVRSRRSSSSAGNPSNVRQGSQMRNEEPLSVEFNILKVSSTSALRRRSLAAEVLLGPILQYLSSEPSSDETVIPEVETAEKNSHTKDESPHRHQSMSPRSRRSSSSAVVPEVETTEYYFDEGNGSPLRRKSLSIRSCRSSSSGGNAPAPGLTPDNPHNDRQGSQMQDSLENEEPLSVEFNTLAFPSTSTMRRRSWAVEVLLDPILQYLNPGHSDKADIEEVKIPVVEATEH